MDKQSLHDNNRTIELLNLRIVPLSQTLLHEEIEPHRVRHLQKQFQINFVLKNPPVATVIEGSNQYLILDGATRTTALKNLGYSFILLQIVTYTHPVQVFSWNHLLSEISPETFQAQIEQEFETIRLDQQKAVEALHTRTIWCYCSFPNNGIIGIPAQSQSITDLAAFLRKFANIYTHYYPIHRLASEELEKVIENQKPNTVVIVYPTFTPQEIVKIAINGQQLPTGITRHLIPGRILNVNFPLEILHDTTSSLEQKNQWLNDWLTRKILNNKVRYYPEPIFVFDD